MDGDDGGGGGDDDDVPEAHGFSDVDQLRQTSRWGASPPRRPLHLAVARGDAAMVRLLLLHGANPTLPDADGRLPGRVCRASKYARCGWEEPSSPPPLPAPSKMVIADPRKRFRAPSPRRRLHLLRKRRFCSSACLIPNVCRSGPNYDDNGSRSIRPHNLLGDALARGAPKLRNGGLARDLLAIQSSW